MHYQSGGIHVATCTIDVTLSPFSLMHDVFCPGNCHKVQFLSLISL